MNHALLAVLAVMVVTALGLISSGRRKQGAAVFAAACFIALVVFPWQAVDFLLHAKKGFRHLVAPRLNQFRIGWTALCAGFSALIGTRISEARPKTQERQDRWEDPEVFPKLDTILKDTIQRPPKVSATLLGLANGAGRVTLDDRARESHMQIVGPTRSGKSQLLFAITAQDMKRGMPVFFMEAKGDRSDFEQFLKLAGIAGRAADVRYFNPHDDTASMTFNPIRPVPGQDATAIANQIARSIGREPTSSGEAQDYYRSVDYAKIQTMAEIFYKTHRQFTFKDCFHYFNHANARIKAFELCGDKRLVGMAVRSFKDSPDSTALTSAIRPWTTGPLGALLNSYSPQIKLEEVFEGKQLAYFAVPVGHLQVLANPLGRMVISGLLSIAASRQKKQPKPPAASIILDEFAEFATPVFASFIATVGSARLWTILSHQDLGQLQRVQGMDVNAFQSVVFNNTSGAKVCFRAPDPEDAEFWSGVLGTHSIFEDTERISHWFLGDLKTGEKSRRMVDHFKIHPNRLKNLETGTAMVFSPGRQDCLARTARVYELTKNEPLPSLSLVETRLDEGLDLEGEVGELEEGQVFDGKGNLVS